MDTGCADDFFHYDSTHGVCVRTEIAIPNCIKGLTTGCTGCNPGFVLDSSPADLDESCVSIQDTVAQCYDLTLPSTCNSCYGGLKVDGNACVFDPSSPRHTGDLSQVIVADGAAPQSCSDLLPGCSLCGEKDGNLQCFKCTEFAHTFYPDIGACIDACDGDDMYMKPNGTCHLCTEILASNGKQVCKTCSYEEGCTSCLDGHTLVDGSC